MCRHVLSKACFRSKNTFKMIDIPLVTIDNTDIFIYVHTHTKILPFHPPPKKIKANEREERNKTI